MRRLLLFVAVLGLDLGGCHDKPEVSAPAPVIHRVEVLDVRVSQRLRHCRAEPEILSEDATQADIAPAYVDALAAGQDCRRKLGAVDALLTAAEKRVTRCGSGPVARKVLRASVALMWLGGKTETHITQACGITVNYVGVIVHQARTKAWTCPGASAPAGVLSSRHPPRERRGRRHRRGHGRARRRAPARPGARCRPSLARDVGGPPGLGCSGAAGARIRTGAGLRVTLPPPGPDAIARQVALLRSMGGGPVPGYSDAERAAARDRIAGALARVADRVWSAGFQRPLTGTGK